MNENLFEAQYKIEKKSKLKRFYETNKILIFLSIFAVIVLLASFGFYADRNEKKKILFSENFIQAKLYLENGKKTKATDILKEIIFGNDPTYSVLSFFLILNQDLISDQKELSTLFDHLLINNKFDEEVKNLLIYKKILFDAEFLDELEVLESAKLLLNGDTVWKPHVLLFLGDYFVSKNEYLKAQEFYTKIFSIKNLDQEIYEQAKSQLISIANE